jgi:transposase InsO family protein
VRPHEHWHVDLAYLNICGTFYYLCSLLDGCSHFVVHWEICTAMTEAHVQAIVQRAREQFPDAHPRIISDNGPQFIAKDFKEFIGALLKARVRCRKLRLPRSGWLGNGSALVRVQPVERPGRISPTETADKFTIGVATTPRFSWHASRHPGAPGPTGEQEWERGNAPA